MKKKKLSLVTQYSLQAVIIFGILALYIASRENFGFKQYEPIISKLYYLGLIAYAVIGLLRKNEKTDESAERILGKVNHICINITTIGLFILIILVASPMFKEIEISRDTIGLFTLILLLIITGIKPILFQYYDRKGPEDDYLKD
ncbi:hypothetical protein [Tissierella pigra]|uniref:Uncharacterized protein n=1 Tax=Tissierella pigra TaxID=2607614 RepID=A0A6N7XGN8_9FIRM|nr:hypothetical protein [Tissierella pigra]MSU01189.1 hypothetical protein [Tissierella pigra]